MNIKSWIKRIPFAVKVHRKVTTLGTNRSNKNILKQLEINRYHQGIQIREALILLQRELPQSDQDWKDRIEVERERLLRRNEPLNDGSLGETGLYDNGVSISCL